MTTSISLRRAVCCALWTCPTLFVTSLVLAQEQDARRADIEEVIVTGTAIRRVEAEASLPVQVLDAQAIARTGAASVVDLMQRLPTIQGATVESDAVGAATFGFSGVSIHNIGENRTLVLLNGRRMAQFGGQTLTGFGAAVDLNSIPVSAIQRVEILTSGASALYGSDAVAGVVNFITKDKTLDRDASVRYYGPEDGARERGISLTAGVGDYEQDGWNVFVALAGDKRDELNSKDRDFANSAIVNFNYGGQRWTYFNGSPRNIPANLVATTGNLAGETVSLDLLSTGACPVGSAPVGSGCYYDYVKNIQLYPERERKNASASLNVKVGESHNLFVDALWSEAKSVSKIAPVPGELGIEVGSALYNQYLAGVTDDEGNPLFGPVDEDGDGAIDPIVAPYRTFDLGQRMSDDEAKFYHAVAGLEGDLAGWSYNFALSQSESDVKAIISGYPGALAFDAALASGNINPLVGPGQQTEAGLAALNAINYRGYWDGGTSRMQTAEVSASRELFEWPNGKPVLFAVGLSHYREKFQSKPSQFAQANLDDPVAGTPAAGGPGTGDQRFGDAAASIPYSADRKVVGVFTEINVQPMDWLELTGAARYDDYNDVGTTTNYKASFKVTPTERLLIRGSYGTGFHAPTVPQLNASLQNYGVTANPYDCTPDLAAIAGSLGAICRPPQTQYDVFAGGNPELTPEESRQAMLGAVFEFSRQLSVGMDYWWVGIEDAFGQIEETEAFANPTLYPDAWTTFTDIGTGTTYLAYNQTNINTGKEYYSGIDLNADGNWQIAAGRLRTQLVATYMLVNKLQLTQDGPYYRNISNYSTALDTVTFRWSGRLLTSFDHGSWSHTITANYKSGYRDVETTVDGIDADGNFNGEVADVRLDVDDYYTFDWQSSWSVTDWVQLTVGALNLLDEEPPLSLTASNFQIGYDARFYDPRGRVLFGQLSFKF
jgi:iron complex outermembrane recepter protein